MLDSEKSRAQLLSELKELRGMELQYRKLSLLSSDFFHACSRTGLQAFQVFWLDGAVEKVTGYTQQEIKIAGCWLPFIHPEDAPAIGLHLLTLKPGDTGTWEFRLIHKDGGLRWVRESYSCEGGESPAELVLYGSIREITERKQAEEKLRETKNTLSLIIESTSDWVLSVEPNNFCLLLFNSAVKNHFADYFAQEIKVGMAPDDLLSPELAAIWKGFYSKVLNEGHFQIEYQTFAASKTLLLSFDRVLHGDEVVSIVMVGKDITQRKRVEERLRQSEDKFRTIFDSITEVLFVHDCETGRILDVNNRACEMFGYSRDELVELDVEAISSGIAPYNQANALDKMRMAMEGQPQRFEWQTKTRWRELFWLEISIRMACIGNETRLLVSGRDITDRKNAENAALREKAFTDSIMNSMPGLLYLYDIEGNLVRWNKKHEELTGYTAEELARMTLYDWYKNDPDEMLKIKNALKNLSESGFTEAEANLQNKDGSKRLYYFTAVPVTLEGKQYVTGVGVDITERKHLQELMVQTEKMMSVGGLAAGMAHEINNPLSAIIQSIQVVQNRLKNDSPANREIADKIGCTFDQIKQFLECRDVYCMLQMVRDSGSRAAKIVSSMLEFSRKTESQFAPTDINALLEKAIELCTNDYDLSKQYDFKRILIEKDFAPGHPTVPCTATRIEQVVINLLRNAAQAMPERAKSADLPRITLRTRQEADCVLIEVYDNGPGMPEEVKKRVFEPFFTTKSPGQGTGLGLSVSYFIITENHKGSLEVESQPGKGSTFTIRLPLQKKATS